MQKTRRHGILSKTICLALIIMTVASLGLMSAGAAGNIRDENYTFDFFYGSEVYTTRREKLDYTSSYMKCTGAQTPGNSYKARVMGSSSQTSARIDCSNGGAYERTFFTGSTVYVPNLVKEKSLNYACIRGNWTRGGGLSGNKFYGVWSPDSV